MVANAKRHGTKGSSDFHCVGSTTVQFGELAWDATAGAGNTSEVVDYSVLDGEILKKFGRSPTSDERQTFARAWQRTLEMIAHP